MLDEVLLEFGDVHRSGKVLFLGLKVKPLLGQVKTAKSIGIDKISIDLRQPAIDCLGGPLATTLRAVLLKSVQIGAHRTTLRSAICQRFLVIW